MHLDGFDVVTLLGLAMLGVGVWMLSPAWSLIVIGSLLTAWGLRASAAAASRRKANKDGE
ncbi:MAG: hypothetical protein IT435_05570 [Phycisphaerales bacterium]|nr:hypothetical protein [Phycisphaerales bacterium]